MTINSASDLSNRRIGFRGIQARLTALVLILAIPLLIAITVYLSSRAGSEIQNQALTHLQENTDAVSTNVTTWLDMQVRSMQSLALMPDIIGMNAAKQKPSLQAITTANPDIFLVHTLDVNGMDVARNDDAALTDYKDRVWFQSAANGNPVTYQVLISRTINKPALSISTPIHNSSGEIIGVLGYTSELTRITNEVIGTGEGSVIVYIVDENNRVVAHPDPTYTSGELKDLSTYPPVAALGQGITGQYSFTDENGVAWNAYLGSLNNGWRIITQERSEDLLAPVRQFQIVAGILMTGGSLLMILALWFAIRRLLKPIGTLTKTVSAIGAGDLNQVADVQGSDEIGVLAATFNDMTAKLRESFATLEQRVAERTQGLELASEVGRAVSQVRDLDIMLKDAVELIRSRFGLYYVQVYLTDPSQTSLVLKAGTGSAGVELLGRGHYLPLQTNSINGRAAIEKHPVVVSDTATSASFKPNPLLPDTRSEMAVPLIVGEKVVGVLDMQSHEAGILNEEITTAYEALAGQLAIAIQNATFLEETKKAQSELEKQAARLARANWEDYLDAINKAESIGFTFEHDQITPFDAKENNAPVVEGQNALVAPITITGEPLGNLVVELEGDSPVSRANELVNNVARQVAQQIENLRLLEAAERSRLEAEKASRRVTREGWKEFVDEKGGDRLGYFYNLSEVQPLTPATPVSVDRESSLMVPVKVRDESVGKIVVEGLDTDDEPSIDLVNAVAERLGAHIESLRQQDQTQAALEQTEKLSAANLRLAQATDLQDMLKIIGETMGIPAINRLVLDVFNYNSNGELEEMVVSANWWDGTGHEASEIGRRFNLEALNAIKLFTNPTPIFSNDTFNDERISGLALSVVKEQNMRAMASLPLYIGNRQIGVLMLESENVYNFTTANIRLFTAMAPQIATVLENRLQFERAQKQAERQSTLNIISQKIQSATSVEAVLQIAARELGHALGAPRTIAQLSIRDKK